AIAPVLRSDPLEHLQSVIELCRRILIGHDAGRVTAAAEIDTDAGIAGTGELGVDRVIATGGHVVLAVGNVLENSGNSLVTEIFRQPDTGGEFDSIAQWNPRVFDDANRSRVFAIAVGRCLGSRGGVVGLCSVLSMRGHEHTTSEPTCTVVQLPSKSEITNTAAGGIPLRSRCTWAQSLSIIGAQTTDARTRRRGPWRS